MKAMNLPADFAFTQGSLQDAADCLRRFELRYIKRLRYPAVEAVPALQFEQRTRQGARFHKLVQQHLLGVPADTLAQSLHDDPELATWWGVFRAAGLAGLPRAAPRRDCVADATGGSPFDRQIRSAGAGSGRRGRHRRLEDLAQGTGATPLGGPLADHPLSLCAGKSRRVTFTAGRSRRRRFA